MRSRCEAPLSSIPYIVFTIRAFKYPNYNDKRKSIRTRFHERSYVIFSEEPVAGIAENVTRQRFFLERHRSVVASAGLFRVKSRGVFAFHSRTLERFASCIRCVFLNCFFNQSQVFLVASLFFLSALVCFEGGVSDCLSLV